MFGKRRERSGGASGLAVAAPVSGVVVPLEQVPDPTFAQGILGKGVAIEPDEGCITAPADGTIEVMFDTGHAVSMTTADGIELLIHVGVDTVALKGRHYKAYCRSGDTVRKGDKLIEFNREAIRAEGYQTVTPVIVCNADSYVAVRLVAAGAVTAGDHLLAISKK